MAAELPELRKMLKGANLAPIGLWIYTPQRYQIRKKIAPGRQNHVHPKKGSSQLDFTWLIQIGN